MRFSFATRRTAACLTAITCLFFSEGCRGLGDGRKGLLAIGFDPAASPLEAGRELALALEWPRERGHFCIGNCQLDAKLEAIDALVVESSRPDVLEVMSVDLSDRRAPLVRVWAHAHGEAVLRARARGATRAGVREDDWRVRVAPTSGAVVSLAILNCDDSGPAIPVW
jgi:hypothetical protein